MQISNNKIHIQQGEIWSLDFHLTAENKHPYLLHKRLKNPFLVMTISKNTYSQSDDFKEVHWLNLKKRYVEDAFGHFSLKDTKKFTSTEPLYLSDTSLSYGLEDLLEIYPKLSTDEDNAFYIENFLFYLDPEENGEYVYCLCHYDHINGTLIWTSGLEVLALLDFRIIKHFDTKTWSAGTYLFEMKIVDGELSEPNADEPLASGYDTLTVLQYPATICVGTNLQGGNK